jgi:acyl-CoA thioester hydrolase
MEKTPMGVPRQTGAIRTPGALGYPRRIAWSECDPAGWWRFTSALSYVEEAETELLRTVGVLDSLYRWLPRIYVDARFTAPARFDDEVLVRLRLARIGTSSLHYEFEIRNGTVVAATGRLGTAFVDPSGASRPLPAEARMALAAWMET